MENALIAGLDYERYWEYTYGEIIGYIKAYNKRKQDDMKTQATFCHAQANLIGMSVARLMDDKSKYPSLYESFPGLFKEEAAREEELRKEREWQLYKARIMEYSIANNSKRARMKEGE